MRLRRDPGPAPPRKKPPLQKVVTFLIIHAGILAIYLLGEGVELGCEVDVYAEIFDLIIPDLMSFGIGIENALIIRFSTYYTFKSRPDSVFKFLFIYVIIIIDECSIQFGRVGSESGLIVHSVFSYQWLQKLPEYRRIRLFRS